VSAPTFDVPVRPYHPALRVLHWLTAVLVFVALPVGFVIDFIKDESKTAFYLVHESAGFLVLWVMLARVVARWIWPPPPNAELPPRLHLVATFVHGALYAALILQPVFGFLATNAFGFPFSLFGVLPIPSPIGKDPALAPYLMGVHVFLGYSILVLFCLHIGGVLYHHVIRRDATLHRML
jgi:cytochrome b561